MKINDELYKKIMSCSRQILLEKPYESLTMRYIAGECDVSVGTLYNCFESKEVLVARIMLDDWTEIIRDSLNKIESVKSCMDGFQVLFVEIRSFAEIYSNVFESYPSAVNLNGSRHNLLIGQISDLVKQLVKRFGVCADPDPTAFIAENLLMASCRKNMEFKEISVFLERIIKN